MSNTDLFDQVYTHISRPYYEKIDRQIESLPLQRNEGTTNRVGNPQEDRHLQGLQTLH